MDMFDVTVFDNQFAPVTSVIGFVNAPIERVTEVYKEWVLSSPGREYVFSWIEGGLWEAVWSLEPVVFGGSTKRLFVQTASSEWTAFFDNGAWGGDPTSGVSALGQRLGVQSLYISSKPAPPSKSVGSRRLVIFEPDPTPGAKITRLVRAIELIKDGRWTLHLSGDPLPFEDLEAYKNRRVAERFTPDMLNDYCVALGLRPFDDDFYPGPCFLSRRIIDWPVLGKPETFAEAQLRLGITRRDQVK
ncbi:hypothetical protein [Rathayibacter toxicus]|uniref:Uncharacterized protein n=1 Tax=Rathayibacter toxicus TaxID=145458 RepID=A0A0C5BFV6_9MICO|nr:hypothetical protein [Rathayibacter toxicus]AJM77979.1 hypothetical protein TI83_08555 [Rathayibacter toxicus]ALS57811.1 hypothetical protein APU90_08525 [Rathayibacter toxicus]KKM46988.1 hypothetical protein VT73_01695 [Rathayibacter toxicus]PPG20520.1 hypothetical protein C5D15_08400 [Rathayibacter toxicus]PPG45622.1 hypothetical protein C5D16_08370 [Rathayibacter toxicus]